MSFRSRQMPEEPRYHCRRPLDDATNQIRLLRLTSGNSSTLDFEVTRWPMDAAPDYNAISYVWGPNQTRTRINVGGAPLYARQSALQQAVAVVGYIWIDSICIKQDDLHEKNQQVQRMHTIYRNAHHVLACLGNATAVFHNLSELCANTQKLDSWRVLESEDANEHAYTDSCHTLFEEYKQMIKEDESLGLTHDDAQKFFVGHVLEFGQWTYWSRLWIIQEIVIGGHAVWMLCGDDFMSWMVFSTLLLDFARSINARSHLHGLSDIMLLNKSPLFRLLGLQRACANRGGTAPLDFLLREAPFRTNCFDPRDQIYGLWAIIDWPALGIEPIPVDYTRSAWSLAWNLIPLLPQSIHATLMSKLKLPGSPEMDALVLRRLAPRFHAENVGDLHDVVFSGVLVMRLLHPPGTSDGTHLCAAIDAVISGSTDLDAIDRDTKLDRLPGLVRSTNHLVAAVCSETLPGDFIVLLEECSPDSASIVLRPTKSASMDVVGTAMVSPDVCIAMVKRIHNGAVSSLQSTTASAEDVFRASLRLLVTTEDLMMIGHWRRGGGVAECTGQDRSIRLIDSPEAVARFEPAPPVRQEALINISTEPGVHGHRFLDH